MAPNEEGCYTGPSLASLPTEILTRIVRYLLPQVDFPKYEVESLPDGIRYWRWNVLAEGDLEGPRYWKPLYNSGDLFHLVVTSRLMSAISLPLLYQRAAPYDYESFARLLETLVEKKPEMQGKVAHLLVENAGVRDTFSCRVTKYLKPDCLNLSSLKSLDIMNVDSFENIGFLGEWLQLLPHLPSLERLVLRRFQDSLEGLPFPQLPNLKELHLYDSFVSDESDVITMLNNVPNLRVLVSHCGIFRLPAAAWDACGDALETFACTISWINFYHLHKLTNLKHLKVECDNIYSHQTQDLTSKFDSLAKTLETVELMASIEDELIFPGESEGEPEDERRFAVFKNVVLDLEKKCRADFKKLRVIDVRSFHSGYYDGTRIYALVREFLDTASRRLRDELGVTLLHHEFPESCGPHVLYDRSSDEDSEDEVDDEASDSDSVEDTPIDLQESFRDNANFDSEAQETQSGGYDSFEAPDDDDDGAADLTQLGTQLPALPTTPESYLDEGEEGDDVYDEYLERYGY
jgi:hypothetical protein